MPQLTLPPKGKKILLWLAGALLIYAVLGFLAVPAILSHQIPKLAHEKLGRQARIKAIAFNPFSLELTADGFDLDNRDAGEFSGFERLYVDLAVWQSIVDLTLTVEQISLSRPYLYVARDRKGAFNFADLAGNDQAPEERTENGELFPATLKRVAISEGKVTWEDKFYSNSQREDIYPVDLQLSNLTTRVNGDSQLGFSLGFASGGSFTWEGELSLNPLSSAGRVTLQKVSLPRVWELFLKHAVQFRIVNGSESIEADYSLSEGPAGPQLTFAKGRIDLYNIQLTEPEQKDVLIDIPDFKVSGISGDLQRQTLAIADVEAKAASFKAWLNPDGSINYQSLFASGNSEPAPAKPSAGVDKPWLLTIARLAFTDFSLHFLDKTLPEPAPLELSAVDFKTHDLSSKPGTKLAIDLGLTVNRSGRLRVEGDAVIAPLAADLRVKADAIAIADFQPYLDQAARLDVVSGLFNADVGIAITSGDTQQPAIRVQGGSEISDFACKDRVSHQDFVKWGSLAVRNMDFDLAANDYRIEAISLQQPYGRILIKKDKSTNIDDIVVAKTESDKPQAEQTAPEAGAKAGPAFKIGRIDINEGESDFADLSLILPFSAHINRLQGSLDDISSAPDDNAKIKLAGRVDDLSPVSVEGQINPHRGDSEFALEFKGMSMPLITPYMAEFAGRKIEKGNLSLGLRYKIHDRQLTASNNLLIENLVLGEKVDNPKAVSLPLNLAIALLEDSDGKIALDVPITGSLEDPKFSVASVVADALVNVITKIVSSPFNAIASLIEGGEDISSIPFPAGRAELTDEQRAKLDDLAAALAERPKLNLEIKGAAYAQHDWPPLQIEALNKRLREIRAEELNRDGKKNLSANDIRLSDEDYHRLLADLFIQKYPQLAERSFFGTPRLVTPEMGDFYDVAKNKLAADIPPDPLRLRQLAKARAQTIARYLVDQGIDVNRLFMLDVQVELQDNGKEHASTLNLTVR